MIDTYKHMVLNIESNNNYGFNNLAERFLASSGNTSIMAGDKICSLRPRDLTNNHAVRP